MSVTTSSFPLGGDGVCENLFHYLWSKDEQDCGPNINIPDTIVFMYCQPAYWYFTSSSGQIKRKNRYNLTAQNIEDAFRRKEKGSSDVLGYYLSTSTNGEGKKVTTIEYFNEEALHDFLFSRQKVNNGILQRFIEPKGTRNEMLRSIWSPKVCLLERRVNIRKLQDTRFDMYERAATYEGVEVNSKTAPVRGAFLPTKLQMLNEAVVQHVAEVSFHKYKINRMVLNFKVDPHDRLYLLWCSSLRLHGGVRADLGAISIDMGIGVPDHVSLSGVSATSHPLYLRKTFLCPSCHKMVEPQRKYQVSYKTLIAQFEGLMRDHYNLNKHTRLGLLGLPSALDTKEASCVGLGGLTWAEIDSSAKPLNVPPVIQQMHPKLLPEDYLRYRKDPLFLYKTTWVCEDCYLAFADVASTAMSATPLLMPGLTMDTTRRSSDGRISKASVRARARARMAMSQSTTSVGLKGRGGSKMSATTSSSLASSSRHAASQPSLRGTTGSAAAAAAAAAARAEDTTSFGQQLGPAPSISTFERIDETSVRPQFHEEEFFRDMYRKPHLAKGDPLHHLVKSQTDMQRVPKLPEVRNPGLGQSLSRRAAKPGRGGRGESLFEPDLRPYASVQYLQSAGGKRPIVLRGHSRSTSSAAAGGSRTRRSRKGGRSRQGRGGTGGGSGTARTGGSSAEAPASYQDVSESAKEHRQFLLQTLKQVKNQLTGDEFVPGPEASDGGRPVTDGGDGEFPPSPAGEQ